ncbi:MAG: histidine kinase [Crocinitomicaceae bacterium]|nr:histidine kinase [Crocinitomicaceae bacterium]
MQRKRNSINFSDTRETFLLDLTDGINTKDINALALHDDYLFIASTRGLYQYPLNALRKNKTKIQVQLEDVLINNQPVSSVEPIEMYYDDDLRILFNAASFRSRGQFFFRYKFSKDNAWNYVDGKNRELYFNSLASGEYELWLDAVNEDGYSSESFLKIQLVVYPPFWQRWWFYLVIVLLTGMLAALFYTWQIRSIRRKSLLKEKLIRYQLRTIKAQMNPHFIFNSLTSIQDLILQKDISNSYLYLTKFSSILRMVIDLTDTDEISLADEIKFLSLYLEIEKLRFGDDFEYALHTPDENETYYANLPPLLIQPFVENAIKHGLLHKRGEKKLYIHFEVTRSKDESCTIHCTIRDNGIGRKRSQEIKERMTVSHHSFATRATEQRLELLNGRDDYRVTFAIEDLYSDNEAAGTQVNITVTADVKDKLTQKK